MSKMTIAEFEQVFMSLASDLRSYVPVLWRGPIGVGKTATVGRLAHALGRRLAPLEFAHCAEEDAGGIPVRDAVTGQVVRLPIGPLRTASEEPTLLFLDEVSRANEVKQGALLTLINERRAGDFTLHKDTIVALAANGTDAVGAFKLIDALNNRVITLDAQPSLEEVFVYLRSLGGDKDPFDIALRDMAIDWAATAERTPSLVQIEPPPGAAETGEQHPSPRMCEKACRALAKMQLDGLSPLLQRRVLAGAVSDVVANAYFAVRLLRDNLPSAKEICDDPKKAKLPMSIETAAAAMALIEQAGLRSPDAAWVYASRLKQDDIRVAVSKRLTARVAAHSREAIEARVSLMASSASAVRSAM